MQALGRPKPLSANDVLRTYRYLRIGMILAVVVLSTAIFMEHSKTHCWQTSISAYYYTPARAIFVGFLIAVGFSLIVIRGRTPWEDIFLNFAGLLAPVVAVAPTTDVGKCWSVAPSPLPVNNDGTLASWVTTNVHDNFYTLLIAATIGLAMAVIVAVVVNQGAGKAVRKLGLQTIISLGIAALIIALGFILIRFWKGFYTKAHGYSATVMVILLGCAVISRALQNRERASQLFYRLYAAIAVLMAAGGILIPVFGIGGAHVVFVVETYEILLFAGFWGVQTVENWDEDIEGFPVAPELAPPPATGL